MERSRSKHFPPLPAPLSGGAGAVLDGHFYVAGGYGQSGAAMDGLWALDLRQPDAGWRSRAAMPSPVRGYFGLVACGGALYALGGCIVETEAHPNTPSLQRRAPLRPATRRVVATATTYRPLARVGSLTPWTSITFCSRVGAIPTFTMRCGSSIFATVPCVGWEA